MDVLPGALQANSVESLECKVESSENKFESSVVKQVVTPKFSAEQVQALRERLRREADEAVNRIVAAVDNAADGRWIADSEEPARRAIHDFGEAAFQAVLQDKIDAFEASFPPSAGNGDRSGDAPAVREAIPE
jgi:uncharacterized protein with PIN domain